MINTKAFKEAGLWKCMTFNRSKQWKMDLTDDTMDPSNDVGFRLKHISSAMVIASCFVILINGSNLLNTQYMFKKRIVNSLCYFIYSHLTKFK